MREKDELVEGGDRGCVVAPQRITCPKESIPPIAAVFVQLGARVADE
jgi:hypothetical protein